MWTSVSPWAWEGGLWDGENQRHGREIGCFEFQSAADRSVFETLVADLSSGAYRSADRYQRRALLKRGPEGGGAWKAQSETGLGHGLGHGLGQGLRHEHGTAWQYLPRHVINAMLALVLWVILHPLT
jgi:hypothetical protein